MIADLRPEVLIFACAMEKKLRENDHKGGWDNSLSSWLFYRLEEEINELKTAKNAYINAIDPLTSTHEQLKPYRKAILDECVDVANFSMMIASVCRALDEANP